VGVLAPRVQLGLQSLVERRWQLGFHMVACVNRAPSTTPYIY
jgi:hypothetical protein